MNAYEYAAAAAGRVRSDMAALRTAERDAALHCDGMAFDCADADEVYRAALQHRGVPRSETAGLDASELQIILRNLPRHGSSAWRAAPALAFDASQPSVLDDILAVVKPPRDRARNDIW